MLSANRFTATNILVPNINYDTTELLLPNNNSCFKDQDHEVVVNRPLSITVTEGNILCIDDKRYFWLQRKVRTTYTNGTIRAGYCLKSPVKRKSDIDCSNSSTNNNEWDVEVSSVGTKEQNDTVVPMVAVRIEEITDFIDSSELATLKYIVTHSTNKDMHIQNDFLLASDSSHVYIVMPYEDVMSISLFDYCNKQPKSILSESTTKKFARQILQGLVSLQRIKLYHQNLTLDSVKLRPIKSTVTDNNRTDRSDSDCTNYTCIIQQMEHVIHVTHPADDRAKQISQSTKGRLNIHYLAPEVWNSDTHMDNNDGKSNNQIMKHPIDGYAVELWAFGVMMLSMLFGSDTIFVAPIQEDRIFQQICIHGQLKEFTNYYHKQTNTPVISDTAIDLIQNLLNYNPKNRPTLTEVLHHPWINSTE